MPPVTVTVLAGPAAGITCTKDAKAKQKVCLGRNKTGNLIALKDDQVSGKHLELSWADGSWFALDLNSTNGTRQNGSNSKFMEGQKYKLRSGDTLQLGPDTVVQVQFDVSRQTCAHTQLAASDLVMPASCSVAPCRSEPRKLLIFAVIRSKESASSMLMCK